MDDYKLKYKALKYLAKLRSSQQQGGSEQQSKDEKEPLKESESASPQEIDIDVNDSDR